MADRWRRYFATSLDEGRKLIRRTLSGLVFDVAGVLHAQVLNHGNVHREQICAILTSLDFEPPDISGWGFGESTGRLSTSDQPQTKRAEAPTSTRRRPRPAHPKAMTLRRSE